MSVIDPGSIGVGATEGAVGGSALGPIGIGAGAALGGFLSFEGQQNTNAQNASLQAGANELNKEMMYANQAFQERMSNTAYQRATTDMRAAGINPMLAYMQGGASSPSGSMAQASAASMQNPMTGFGQLGQSAQAASQFALQQQMQQKQIEKTDADILNTQAQTNMTLGQTPGKTAESSAAANIYNRLNSAIQSGAKSVKNWMDSSVPSSDIKSYNKLAQPTGRSPIGY